MRWTCIPSKGSRSAPSHFILLKPKISTDEPVFVVAVFTLSVVLSWQG